MPCARNNLDKHQRFQSSRNLLKIKKGLNKPTYLISKLAKPPYKDVVYIFPIFLASSNDGCVIRLKASLLHLTEAFSISLYKASFFKVAASDTSLKTTTKNN